MPERGGDVRSSLHDARRSWAETLRIQSPEGVEVAILAQQARNAALPGERDDLRIEDRIAHRVLLAHRLGEERRIVRPRQWTPAIPRRRDTIKLCTTAVVVPSVLVV